MTDQTSPPTEQQLDAITARKNAATEGSWRGTPATDAFVGEIWSTGDRARCLARVSSDADTRFIAHAPQDVEALIAEVRRLRARVLTEGEYDSAWHAVEGAAGEEGADPGTVLHAVLVRLGISLPAPDGSGPAASV